MVPDGLSNIETVINIDEKTKPDKQKYAILIKLHCSK